MNWWERARGGRREASVGGGLCPRPASFPPSCCRLLFDVPRCRSLPNSSLWHAPLGQTCTQPRVSPIILSARKSLYQCQIATSSHVFSLSAVRRSITRRPSPPDPTAPSAAVLYDLTTTSHTLLLCALHPEDCAHQL
ncbi:hypothetical protein BD311DRAFT_408167 [Dichomitus squalens]|uniref:Uncharacterized protein n=1 Tax=Dichomitus squalens TaxID=114155 RepID=A0A4Q9MI13_9APHY|nr:hypothetical protein BD311DRAFT_408167 [Dichomitus squalens]